jgi:hypothetical protein
MIKEFRTHFKKRYDTKSWIDSRGEITPIPYIPTDHLLQIGRRLERTAREKIQTKLQEKKLAIEQFGRGQIIGINKQKLDNDIKILTELVNRTIDATIDATPIYVHIRDELESRGLFKERNETVEKALNRYREELYLRRDRNNDKR